VEVFDAELLAPVDMKKEGGTGTTHSWKARDKRSKTRSGFHIGNTSDACGGKETCGRKDREEERTRSQKRKYYAGLVPRLQHGDKRGLMGGIL